MLTKGAATTDTSATWVEITGQPGMNGDHFSATTTTTNGATAAGGTVLSFASVPANVAVGQIVIDKSVTTVIPAGTKVIAFTSTTVTLSAATTGAGVLSGATIAFSNCPTWGMQASQAITLGMVISNNAGTFLFVCTTAGTAGASEPAWTLTAGVNTTDNASVHWMCLGANAGFTAWGAPFARITPAIASTWAAAGDSIFVGDDHAETQGAAMAITGGTVPLPLRCFCVSHTATLPPGSANVTTGASATTTTTFALSIGSASGCGLYFNGIKFSSGSGANATALNICTTQTFAANMVVFENCALVKAGTTAANVVVGTGLVLVKIRFNNTTITFGATGDRFQMIASDFIWKNTASAIGGSTFPTTLIVWNANDNSPTMICDGVDFSAITGIIFSNTTGGGKALFVDCKLASTATPSTTPTFPSNTVDFIRCSSAAHDYDIASYRYEGKLLDDVVVTRTGGASDGTTGVSYAITTTANVIWVNPMECLPITIWNSTTGTRIITVYGIANMANMPLTDQIWFDVEYLGSASTPLASFNTTGKASQLASGVVSTTDTSAWDSAVTVRANGETVAVGTIRKTTDSPGLVWFCTAITTGVLAGAEPGGMGSAVDGAVVTDGGAIWRAGWRFSQAVTLSPNPGMVGYLRVVPKMAVTSTTIYVDPLPVLS